MGKEKVTKKTVRRLNMWSKETTCNCCDKDFSYEYEDLKSYETIYEGGLTAWEFVICPHCGAEVITDI